MTELWLPFILIVFAAAFTSGMVGFGAALVSMPLLISLVGLQTARPVFALAFIALEAIMIISYRKDIEFRSVWRLIVPSVLAIPLGLWAVDVLPEVVTLSALGMILVAYSLYNLLGFALPRITNKNWAFPFGVVSGVLSGAFNTAGPPLILYGDMSRWKRETFKGSIQSVFIANNMIVNVSHFARGNHSSDTLQLALLAMPAIVLGVYAGKAMDRFVNRALFRKIVLVMLFVIGARLLILQLL